MGERDDGQIKLHKRTVVLDRTPRTVLSPRPSDGHRWATNRHHDEWHVLSDHEGGRRLGRLLWIMADQQPGTLLVVDPGCLVTNPFDADPSMPIVVMNRALGPASARALDDLSKALPFRSPSEGTVKVRTRGLDDLLARLRAWRPGNGPYPKEAEWWRNEGRGRIDASHGLLLMTGSPDVLRAWARDCLGLDREGDERAEDYAELDAHRDSSGVERGEVQTFLEFALYCEQARVVRHELFPTARNRALTDDERRQVWEALPPRERD